MNGSRYAYAYPMPPMLAQRSRADVVGFVAPTITYDRMRQIQASAVTLDANIRHYVTDESFRRAWAAWYAEWLPFYEKYAGPDYSTSARLAAAFESDELSQQTESYRQTLERFASDYRNQRQANGQPVPPLAGGSPSLGRIPLNPHDAPANLGIPAWLWVVGGVALAGAGYYGYTRLRSRRGSR